VSITKELWSTERRLGCLKNRLLTNSIQRPVSGLSVSHSHGGHMANPERAFLVAQAINMLLLWSKDEARKHSGQSGMSLPRCQDFNRRSGTTFVNPLNPAFKRRAKLS
jgi:hypothetical protein